MNRSKHNLVWPLSALFLFAVLRHAFGDWIASTVPALYGEGIVSAFGVLMIVASAIVLDRLIRIFYWDGYLRRKRQRDTPALIEDIFTIALIVLGASAGLFFEAGVSFAGLLTASGATAIVLGIALQVVINDIFSGLSLNVDNSYAIGDWLTIFSDQLPEPTYGQVQGITWRSTFLRLQDGRSMMVPNHLLTSNPVINHSRPPGPKRLFVEVPVANDFPIDRAISILLAAAYKKTRESLLSNTPEPDCIVEKSDSDSVFFHVRFWADPNVITPSEAKSVMSVALGNALFVSKVPSPVTQVEIVQPINEEQLESIDARTALGRVPIFKDALDQAQMDMLFAACFVRTIPAGTVFIHQGDPGTSMFVLLEGAARVSVSVSSGEAREVAILSVGEIVGEMSLMTGSLRTATVTSLTPLRAIEVTKESVEPLLAATPGLLERFGHVLAARQAALATIANAPVKEKEVELDILARMRKFFSRAFRGTAANRG